MVTYAAETPDEYLDQLDPDWRRDKVMAIREIVARVSPDWEEVMHYGMLGYGPPDDPVMHLNAQKGYVGLYVGDVAAIDPDRSMLGPMDCGKGCVRFKKKNEVGEGVERFLTRYVEMKAAGVDFGC